MYTTDRDNVCDVEKSNQIAVTDYKFVVINPAQQWLSKTTCMEPGDSNFVDDKFCCPRRRTFSEYTCMKRMQYVFVIFN